MITKADILSFEREASSLPEQIAFRKYVDERKSFFLFKRIADILVSTFMLIFFLSWLTPLLALLILIDSRGPIFFLQRRVGRGGRSFYCIKFRTMVINEEANKKQAEEDDLRITRIGRFLRKSNMDELPQFLNVLIGQMSLVGPRPHMHSDCNKFSDVVQRYKFRNMVKPGITGLAQVKGFRGPTKDFESIFHRYQYDAFYIRNASFVLDMRILRKTFVQTILIIFSYLLNKHTQNAASFRKFATAVRNML